MKMEVDEDLVINWSSGKRWKNLSFNESESWIGDAFHFRLVFRQKFLHPTVGLLEKVKVEETFKNNEQLADQEKAKVKMEEACTR